MFRPQCGSPSPRLATRTAISQTKFEFKSINSFFKKYLVDEHGDPEPDEHQEEEEVEESHPNGEHQELLQAER